MRLGRALLILILFAGTLRAGGRMVIVVGAEGEPEYGPQFAQWANRFAAAANAGGLAVIRIGEVRESESPAARSAATRPATTGPTTSPASDKDNLRIALIGATPTSANPLWLVLIGHGTSDGLEAKFNLRGPDVSDKELTEWLRPVKGPIAVVNCSSASAPFLNKLSAADRVIVTATRGGTEIQFSRFGEFLSAAIADPVADLDKDGQTSLLEAFLFASRRVDVFYKENGRIVTEHALLDDNGDGLGVSADWFDGIRPTRSARTAAAVDGTRAHRWVLLPTVDEQALSPQQRARRDAIEASINTLRAQKTTLPANAYYDRLEALMIDLAKVYETPGSPSTMPVSP